MTDVQISDELGGAGEEPSVEEVLAAQEAAARTASSKIERSATEIALFDPDHESLVFGASKEIQFGPRGGFEPNVWRGPRDHPLLEALLLRYPKIGEIGAPEKVYICGVCQAEFKSMAAWHGHQPKHKGGVVKA